MTITKVLIADDHGIVRKGISTLINSIEGMEVVGEASNGPEALSKLDDLKPDILLVDISMPEMNGLQVLDAVREKGWPAKVVILSMHNDEEYVLKAINSGASGYLLKNADDNEIVEGIRTVARGQVFYSSYVSQVMVNSLRKPAKEDSSEGITKREKEVLKYIVEGLSNKEIADKAFISTRTVDKHRASVMKKLNARNAADLVRITIERKLLN